MPIEHSIILAYRERPTCLKCFLRSVELALTDFDKSKVEIVLTELGLDPRTPKIIKNWEKKINIKYYPIDYKKVFWKTKALNHSAKHAYLKTKTITMVDVDSVLPSMFFKNIDDFFIKKNNQFRLSHRVRFLNEDTSVFFRKNSSIFTIKDIQKKCIEQHEKYKLAKERFGTKNLMKSEMSKEESKNPKLHNQALGNSHFTIPAKHYYELLYDETYVGWSYEDLDFNYRYIKVYKKAQMIKSPHLTIYHVAHAHEPDWKNQKVKKRNESIYRQNIKRNITKLGYKKNWGKFD